MRASRRLILTPSCLVSWCVAVAVCPCGQVHDAAHVDMDAVASMVRKLRMAMKKAKAETKAEVEDLIREDATPEDSKTGADTGNDSDAGGGDSRAAMLSAMLARQSGSPATAKKKKKKKSKAIDIPNVSSRNDRDAFVRGTDAFVDECTGRVRKLEEQVEAAHEVGRELARFFAEVSAVLGVVACRGVGLRA